MSTATGKLVVISVVGIVAAYKLGRYHSTTAFALSSSSSSPNNQISDGSDDRNTHHGILNNDKSNNGGGGRKGTKKKNRKKHSSNDNGIPATPPPIGITSDENNNIQSITMKPIGKISSVYRLCVGTPRQGLLAPNSRGRIDLNPNIMSSDSIQSIAQYSHLWIVFIFHLNSKNQKRQKQNTAKIAPPALGGEKVGVFATRTPHRPNPVGFSLCKIDKVVIPEKKKHIKAKDQPYSIYVSGLDLVDETPVLDIKPYVPHYDSVGYAGLETITTTATTGGEGSEEEDECNSTPHVAQVPKWVNDGLGKRRPVSFTEAASEQLTDIMMTEETANQIEFYGVSSGRDASAEEGLRRIKSCIEEVLSVDVRSSFQTKKARKGKFQAERAVRLSNKIAQVQGDNKKKSHSSFSEKSNVCTQQLDHLLIKYSVEAKEQELDGLKSNIAVNTSGSGADDTIVVQEIELIPQKKGKS
mmetsp:Transcript_3987/g.5788  ORF Transcript_3987/g.5788 Transcript_3987/m.5788 type:complete len:469 (-) Transcript_3987:3-1409(-)